MLVLLLTTACGTTPRYAPSPLHRSGEAPAYDSLRERLRDTPPAWDTNAVTRELERMARTLRSTRYDYKTVVDEVNGYYQFDCSGMAAWVLSRVTPRAHAAVQPAPERRPLAKDFHYTIAAIVAGQERDGWHRVNSVSEMKPGDVVAWLRPLSVDSDDTGHVAFVAAAPVPLRAYDNTYLIRVIDASSSKHADDTRTAANTDGFGAGTIALATTRFGEPTHYSWAADLDRFHRTTIVIGRPLR